MSGCRDSNPESLAPKASMLAVTPHPDTEISYHNTYMLQYLIDYLLKKKNLPLSQFFLSQNIFVETLECPLKCPLYK